MRATRAVDVDESGVLSCGVILVIGIGTGVVGINVSRMVLDSSVSTIMKRTLSGVDVLII